MKRDITILETAVAALTGELSTLRGRVSRKQPLSATLTVLSGLTLAANSLIVGTGADAAEIQVYDANEFPARASTGVLEPKPITDFALTLVDDPDDVTARATLGLVIGTDVQAWDAGLDALAALPGNGFVVQTGADTFANRLLLGTANEIAVDDSDGSAGDVTFSLPASLTFTGKTITGGTYASATLTAPTIADFSNAQHTHLDAAGGGTLTAAAIGDFSEAVDDRVAALLVAGTNITLTYNDVANTLTIDSAGGAGYTDEQAQDAVGTILVDSATLDFTYDDGVPSITADVLDSPLLGGDTPAFYLDRTNHTGTQLAATISDFNEAAQDAVGVILTDTATFNFTYTDATPTITGDVLDSPLLQGQNGAFYLARANHTGTQLAATISDFSEAVDDRVAALLVAGTNITLTYNDVANTLTIDSTGGAGYTDEQAQDAVGTILTDTATLDFIYDDATPTITANVLDSPLLDGELPSFYLDRTNHTGTQLAATISDFATAVETVGDGLYVELAGDTMTGPLVMTTASAVGDGTGNAALEFNGAAGNVSRISLNSGSTSRWAVRKASGAEGGSDTGAPFQISAFTDAGVLIDSPIEITRAAGGAVLVNRPLRVGDGLAGTEELFIDSPAGNAAITSYQSGSITRWAWLKTSTAEAGADAGSDLHLRAHNDAGTIIDTPISIVRAAGGDIDFARNLDMGGNSIGNALSIYRTGGPLRIGAGQTADAALSGGDGAWQVYNTGSAGARASIVMSNSNTSSIARFILGKTNAIPYGTLAAPGSDSIIGQFEWQSTTTVPDFFSAGYVRLAHVGTATATGGDMQMTFAVHDGTASVVPFRIRSTQILGPDGSAAAPAWTFSADPDTGIYRAAADTIGMSTGGVVKMTLSTTDLDITGLNQLHMTSSSSANGILLETSNNSSASPGIFVRGRRTDGNTTPSFSGNLYLVGYRTDAAVTANKNLGVLYFGGNHTDGTDGNIAYAAGIAAQADGAGFTSAAAMPTRLSFYTGSSGVAAGAQLGSESMRISSTGQVRFSAGTASVPGWSFLTDIDTGAYSVGANHMAFSTGGTAFLGANGNSITTGNLGDSSHVSIGAASPYIQVNQSSSGRALSLRQIAANTGGPFQFFLKARGSLGAETAALSGDTLGQILFIGHDGVDYTEANASVEIEAIATSNFAADSRPARLTIRTNDGTASAAPTARMTIRPAGEVLVSSSATAYAFGSGAITPIFQVHTDDALALKRSALFAHWDASTGAAPIIVLAKGHNNTIGDFTTPTPSGNIVGSIHFEASDGTEFSRGARIFAQTEALASAGDVPMFLGFETKADGLAVSTKFVITGDGRIYGTALHNNSGAVTGTTDQYIASGTYTPTLTNSTNVAASTAFVCQWMRVGNVVTVSGQVNIDVTTANVESLLGMSLPIASAFTAANQCGGTGALVGNTTERTVAIRGDATNDRAQFHLRPAVNTNIACHFSFTYVIV